MSTVSVSRIVDVTILVAAVAPQAPTFSRGLCVGSSARLPTYDRLRLYASLLEVAADFQATDEEYKFAQLYFSQEPKPDELMIGRRLTAASAGTLMSGDRSTTLADYTAVTEGGFDVTIDGTLRQVIGINLSAVTDMAGVAAAVQTALQAELAATTCTFDGTNFVITSPTTGATSVVSYASAPTDATEPTDLSAIMGLTVETNARRTSGAAIETIAASLDALQRWDGSWYGFHLTNEATLQNLKDASAWAEAAKKFHFITSDSAPILDSQSTTDLASYLMGQAYAHTFLQYSSTHDYAAGSAMSRGLQVDFDQIDATITLKFKQEPGVTPESLTATQYNTLEAKNANYLATVSNGFTMIFNGVTPSGRFFDEVMGLDWLKADMENEVFTALATSPTKVPQTDKGAQVLVGAARVTLEKAIRNRLGAPGVWSQNGFGALKTGDLLDKGYYVYASPVASQSVADRAARKAPPITFALIGAGAFHSCTIVGNFQR